MKNKTTIFYLLLTLMFFSDALFAQKHPVPPRRPGSTITTTNSYSPNRNTSSIKSHHHKPTKPTPPSKPQLPPPPPSQYNYPSPPPPPNPPSQPMLPPPPPPPPAIKQDFTSNYLSMNLGNLPIHGINLTAKAGAMAEDSSIEIKKLDFKAVYNEIMLNGRKSNRFIPISDLYDIKTKGMNQYSALPIQYAIMAKGNVPNGSRVFFLVKTGNEICYIPAKTTTNYGMVIGEINSCAIYDKIALIADTSYSEDYISSFMISGNSNDNNSSNPYYAELSNDDGFGISTHVFSRDGRNSYISSKSLTIIQPKTSASLNLYKYNNDENIFVQSVPFTTAESYSFCKIDLNNFEIVYDNNSLSYYVLVSFENTNIEDIPNALIFRATVCDKDGVCYSTEDLLVYVGLPSSSYSSPFSSGDGTSSNPYVITSVKQLDKIRDYKRRFFKLGCDLDLSSYQNKNWLALGDSEEPFDGSFDGNNKTIRNLSINEPNENYQGLFGYVKNASIKNIKVELSPEGINCDSFCGIIAGYGSNSRFFQCYSTGFIKSNNYIGGLVGFINNSSSIRKSLSDFDINSNAPDIIIGGLAGCVEDSTITDCHSDSNIVSSGNNTCIGGLVGQGERAKIQNCYSTGSLRTGKTGFVGGLAGYLNNSETKGCIAINSRIIGENQGRIAGKADNSSFIRCFAWEYIRDKNNKFIAEGGFGGIESSKESKNGESVGKDSFYGSKTRNKFWTVNKKVGFNLNSWIFNSGYNLPQIRNMPSLSNPDYLR